MFVAALTETIGIMLTHFHKMATVSAVVCFLLDNLREKRSVPETKYSGIACLKKIAASCWKITGFQGSLDYALCWGI